MSKTIEYRLSLVDREIIITDEQAEKEELRIPILYLKNEKYLTQTDIFQEIRKNISQNFKVKNSDIRLKFGEGEPQQRIMDIAKENQRKHKKR